MKTLFRLMVLVLLISGWALALAAVHVVRTPGPIPGLGNIMVIPKDHLTYRETYVDTREWRAEDYTAHPAIAARLKSVNCGGVSQLSAHACGDLGNS